MPQENSLCNKSAIASWMFGTKTLPALMMTKLAATCVTRLHWGNRSMGHPCSNFNDSLSKPQLKILHGWVITPHERNDEITWPCFNFSYFFYNKSAPLHCDIRQVPSSSQWSTATFIHCKLVTPYGDEDLDQHYNDVIMIMIASQITSLTIVYLTVYSGAHQRKHQSSASMAFVRGIHRGPVNSPHKGPVTRKMFPFNDVIMTLAQVMACCLTAKEISIGGYHFIHILQIAVQLNQLLVTTLRLRHNCGFY